MHWITSLSKLVSPQTIREIKMDLKERFLNFESLNGAVYILWGLGFIYFAYHDIPKTDIFDPYSPSTWILNGYIYAEFTIGVMLTFWGLRKTFVNRIKQAVATEKMIAEYTKEKSDV